MAYEERSDVNANSPKPAYSKGLYLRCQPRLWITPMDLFAFIWINVLLHVLYRLQTFMLSLIEHLFDSIITFRLYLWKRKIKQHFQCLFDSAWRFFLSAYNTIHNNLMQQAVYSHFGYCEQFISIVLPICVYTILQKVLCSLIQFLVLVTRFKSPLV